MSMLGSVLHAIFSLILFDRKQTNKSSSLENQISPYEPNWKPTKRRKVNLKNVRSPYEK